MTEYSINTLYLIQEPGNLFNQLEKVQLLREIPPV